MTPAPLRICLLYDCLFPWTVGGAERWMRNLGERLAADGHTVTYLTRRQWPRGEWPQIAGVEVVAPGPWLALYTKSGRRGVLPPLVFGVTALWHLLRHGRRYDVVHTASFPYFSLLAARLVRPLGRYRLVVDWHEWWTRAYWTGYLGRLGVVGWTVQRLCARVPQRAFCFAHVTAERLRAAGLNGSVTVLKGEFSGEHAGDTSVRPPAPRAEPPVVVFAGRHIPEKQVPALPDALVVARHSVPDLRLDIYGDGPDRALVQERISALELDGSARLHGFVDADAVHRAMASAACLVLPSVREGYGLVVVEAAARGCPSVVVDHPDNAATELVEDGVNGIIAPSATPAELGAAIARAVLDPGLRDATARWYAAHATELALETSLEKVSESYA